MRWMLVDRIEECLPGQRALGLKTFPRSDLFFMDHFPGLPTVPGVLLIEAMAQTAGHCLRAARPGTQTFLAGVQSARFRHRVGPGDTCRIPIDVEALGRDHARVSARVEVAGRRVAQAELLFAMVPRESLARHDEHAQFEAREQPAEQPA